MIKILTGDNIELLKSYPDNYFDSIVTDSPYGLGKEPKAHEVLFNWISDGYHEVKGNGFMGKKWDAFVPQPILWKECYRVLKPGGYCLSFFGARTYDWGVMAMRLAGFEVRDQINWIYGSGFPKSKASLKPAHEPIAVCRKPGPNQLLNIDECRIPLNGDFKGGLANRTKGIGDVIPSRNVYSDAKRVEHDNTCGRWPTNVIFDEKSAIGLDEQSGISGGDKRLNKIQTGTNGNFTTQKEGQLTPCYNDTGGASRFFYIAKSSPFERSAGCEYLMFVNNHPTVKPISLIRQLQRLYTPKGGITLDPFAGSGTAGCASAFEDISEIVLIEREETYIPIIEARTKYWQDIANREAYIQQLKDSQTQLFA
jgi:site-specific DNA-methyltransferase (adenine-specific)